MTTTLKAHAKNSLRLGWLQGVIIGLLVVGVCFHFLCLDRKIYWHDEAYTSLRAAGFTSQSIDQELFQNRWVSVPDLQKFQQLKPNSTVKDTIDSLIAEDPQHPPLYFLMARFWMQGFGSSVFASRLLPVLISLMGLPLMYGLAMELFGSRLTALVATALLALSPFDLLFAQTARQYSLLTTIAIGSSWLLLRAIRRPTWQQWLGYSLSLAVGLYTHPFFALTLIAQGVYVVGLSFLEQTDRLLPAKKTVKQWVGSLIAGVNNRRVWQFSVAVLGALLLYGPWIWVLLKGSQRAMSVTSWAEGPTEFLFFLKLWTLSFTALFIDLDFGFDNPITYLWRLPFVLLILAALYRLYRRTSTATWLFVLTSVLIPFLLLAVPDLLLGSRRSTVSRYLISAYPGVQLAVAYLLSLGLTTGKNLWRWVLALSFACSIVSCSISAAARSWWHQVPSYENAEVVERVQAETNPKSVMLSDLGEDFTNTGDLVALSHDLPESTRLFLTQQQSPNLTALANEPNIMVFRPSPVLRQAITQQGWQLQPVSQAARLWRIAK